MLKSTVTVPSSAAEAQAARAALLARWAALGGRRSGWSQNAVARRIGADPGFVSRVLRWQVKAPAIWRRLDQATTRAERRRAARTAAA